MNGRKWVFTGALATLFCVVSVVIAQVPASESGMSAFGRMVPLGFENKSVTIPAFKDGRTSSLMTAESLTRIDEKNLITQNVVMLLYGKTPEENVRVELKSAVFDMVDQILRSGERSRVSRSDFEMEGDSMIFDARTSVGSMRGRVHTLIFDTGALSATSGSNQPSKQ